ncbi:hypothetical protein [Pseudooceanicola sp. 200-1SW]
MLTDGLDDGTSETDGDLAFMQQWVDELEAFHRKTMVAMTAAPSKPS